MQEQMLNPSQVRTHKSLVREIRNQLRSGAATFEPAAYKLIRRRARELSPVKTEILSALSGAVESGLYTVEEVQAIAVAYYGRKDEDVNKLLGSLRLLKIKLNINKDLELEKVLQAELRSKFDQRLVTVWNENQQPEVLEAEMAQLCQEETLWHQALASLNTGSVLDEIRRRRFKVDVLEALIEQRINQIVVLNGKIRKLKSEVRKANDRRAIEIADEIQQLDAEREALRRKVDQAKKRLWKENHAWMLSHEQRIEHEAGKAITALCAILGRGVEINNLLENPPDDLQVSSVDVDDLNIEAEAHVSVALRLRERAEKPGLSKYKREFLEQLAQGLEEKAHVWEV